jgi:hypothetical protein
MGRLKDMLVLAVGNLSILFTLLSEVFLPDYFWNDWYIKPGIN